jgi:hypothetical protein
VVLVDATQGQKRLVPDMRCSCIYIRRAPGVRQRALLCPCSEGLVAFSLKLPLFPAVPFSLNIGAVLCRSQVTYLTGLARRCCCYLDSIPFHFTPLLLTMRVTSLVSVPALLASLGSAGYVLHDDYGSGASFFDRFSFFTVRQPPVARDANE